MIILMAAEVINEKTIEWEAQGAAMLRPNCAAPLAPELRTLRPSCI